MGDIDNLVSLVYETIAAEIVADIDDGKTITAAITVGSTKRLKLAVGKKVWVIIKDRDVILAVDD